MLLGGALSNLSWVSDGPEPRLRIVSGKEWNGHDPTGAPFLLDPLDPIHGPTAEILVAEGKPLRIVFRVLHGLMDGAGCALFAREFFTALRGEKLVEVNAGPPTEMDIGKKFSGPLRALSHESPPLTGPADRQLTGNTWYRVSIPGRVASCVAAAGIALVQAAVAPVDPERVRYMIPVDMRALARCGHSSANLTGGIVVSAGQAMKAEDPVASLDQDILKELLKREFGSETTRSAGLLPHLALDVAAWLARKFLSTLVDRFEYSAVLSKIGPLDLNHFSGGGFRAKAVFSIPPYLQSPMTPFFMTLYESSSGLELTGATGGCFASDGRLKKLLDRTAEIVAEYSNRQRPIAEEP
jgi:hypothetical protein